MENGRKINHWCVLCGIGYYACDTCNNVKTFTPWRTLTDTIEHFKIFAILRDYNNKIIDRKTAQELLKNLDLSDKENYKDSVKKVLLDIYTEINTETDNIETSSKRKNRKYNKVDLEKEIIPEEIITSEE